MEAGRAAAPRRGRRRRFGRKLRVPVAAIAVKLHRCRFEWLKTGPCWKVEKALKDMGIDYELAPGPSRPSKRDELLEHTGQRFYPAIEFEDGSWYRDESLRMEQKIRGGTLRESAKGPPEV